MCAGGVDGRPADRVGQGFACGRLAFEVLGAPYGELAHVAGMRCMYEGVHERCVLMGELATEGLHVGGQAAAELIRPFPLLRSAYAHLLVEHFPHVLHCQNA